MLFIGGAALLLAIVLILGFGYVRENIWRAQDTVAVIYGERLTAGQLAEEVRPRLVSLERRAAALRSAGLTQQSAQLLLQRATLPESVLNDIIEDRVVRHEAAARGITVTAEETEARLRETIARFDYLTQPQPTPTPPPSPAASPTATAAAEATPTLPPTATPVPTLTADRYGPALQDYLNQTGYTLEQARRNAESELYEEKMRQVIGEEVPAVQEQIHVRHIVFKNEEDARAGLQQLQGGTPFETLAAQQSQDEATKDKGGDLGWLPRLGRDIAFDEAAFALQPGQLSDVVQTASGWEIIQVLERDPARPVDPRYLDEMRRRHYGDWLANAEANPEIDRDLSPEESAWVLAHAEGRRF